MNWRNKKVSMGVMLVCLAVGVAFFLFPSQSARSLTGEEVLDKMSSDHRAGYLAGNIDMAAQLAYHEGKRERSACIFDWYYDKNGVKQVVQALGHFKDRQVQPVIYALINRACGE